MKTAADKQTADSSPDLAELMGGYQQANGAATASLIALASPLLYRFLASQMGSRSEAEDLLQEVWLKIHRSRHTYRPGEPVLPWLYAIARHVRIDNFRKRRRVGMHETPVDVLPEPAFRQQASTSASTAIAFEALLAELPESQREVITLLKVNDLSLEEVARITSSTVGAVKQKAHRAYERLRTVLTQNQHAAQ